MLGLEFLNEQFDLKTISCLETKMSDYIQSLPTDETPVTSVETEIVNDILKNDTSLIFKLLSDMKDPLLGGILFVFLNLTPVKDFIESIVPYAKSSEISSLIFRLIVFVILFFFLKNLALVVK